MSLFGDHLDVNLPASIALLSQPLLAARIGYKPQWSLVNKSCLTAVTATPRKMPMGISDQRICVDLLGMRVGAPAPFDWWNAMME
jgi:hypothetical protein